MVSRLAGPSPIGSAAVIPRAAAIAGIAIGCVLSSSATAADEREPSRGTVTLDIRAGSDAPPWLAGALQEHLSRELATYERLTVLRRNESVRATCDQDPACIVQQHRQAGVDVVFIATAEADAIRYELFETWTPSKVGRGSISLSGASGLIGLRQKLLRVFGPVLTPGGLLDQKPYRTTASTTPGSPPADRGPPPATTISARDLALVVGGVSLLLAMPVVMALLVVRDRRRLMASTWPSTWASITGIAAASIIARRGMTLTLFDWPTSERWLLGLVAGGAWSAFVVTNLRLLVPALPGLDRVAHRDVFRLIRAWLLVCATRFVAVAAYYVPFAIATMVTARRVGLSREFTLILVLPVIGLVARFWLSTWIRGLAIYLDQRLVVGEAGPDNPWHREVSRYFNGYLRRAGWALDPGVQASILFLPGREEGLYVYGGGSSPTRIVIDERTLTLAVGATDDARRDEEKVELVDWSTGVLPAPAAGAAPRKARRRPSGATRKLLGRAPAISSAGHHRKQLGRAATLLGYVTPEPGERIPLIADTVEDLEVVRELLSEHYQWFAPDPDEDHDDTDPTDKDFLFGPLTYAVGKVIRRDAQLGTFSLASAQWMANRAAPLRWLHRSAVWLVAMFLGRSSAVVADSYAALHYARHHHLQYLAYRWSEDTARLTVRAGVGELEQTSKAILRQVRSRLADTTPSTDRRAAFRRRMVWLSSFLSEPLFDRAERRVGRITTALFLLIVSAGIGAAVYDAVLYHPIYVDRMADQAHRRPQTRLDATHLNERAESHVQ